MEIGENKPPKVPIWPHHCDLDLWPI